MDLNHRPRAYQARALNQLSYRPIINYILIEKHVEKLESLSKLNRIKQTEGNNT